MSSVPPVQLNARRLISTRGPKTHVCHSLLLKGRRVNGRGLQRQVDAIGSHLPASESTGKWLTRLQQQSTNLFKNFPSPTSNYSLQNLSHPPRKITPHPPNTMLSCRASKACAQHCMRGGRGDKSQESWTTRTYVSRGGELSFGEGWGKLNYVASTNLKEQPSPV